MAKCTCNCAVSCLAVLFAIFLALDVIFLGATIGLAWYGIEEADNQNSCRASNSTQDCVLLIELMPALGLQEGRITNFNYDLYLYWMGAATVCGLVWACINVLTLISFSELIRTHLGALTKLEKQIANEAHELQPIVKKAVDGGGGGGGGGATGTGGGGATGAGGGGGATGSGSGSDKASSDNGEATDAAEAPPKPKPTPTAVEFKGPDNVGVFTDTIGVVENQEWVDKPLRHFGPLAILSLFLSSVSFACSILCLVWGIAISFNHSRQAEKTIASFVIVELIVALGVPIFLCMSVAFFAVVLEYITIGHLDMRMIIPRLIRIVKFVTGEKYDYWVIDDVFYYPLKKRLGRSDKGCCYSVDGSWTTWFLTIIIGTAVTLVVSYFVDLTLDNQITVTSCSDPLIDRTYDCFNASTLAFVDCVDDTDSILLHCFKFYRFGVETNIITAVTTSYAFYLVTVAMFTHIFSVVRNLVNVKPSRYWGVGFLGVGLIFFACSIIIAVFWIRGYAASSLPELTRINIIHVCQFFMVSTFVTTVGLLLLSKWYEKLNTKVHAKPVQVPLVHYHDTERKYIHKMELADKWPPQAKDSDAS